MRPNTPIQDAKLSQAIKRHETHKATAEARRTTLARKAARTAKYAPTILKAV